MQHDAVRKEQRLNYSKSTQVQNWSSSASLLGRTKMVKWALGFQAWAPWKSGAQTKVGDRFSFLPRTRGEVARGIGAKGSFPVSPFPPYFSLVCFRFNREGKNLASQEGSGGGGGGGKESSVASGDRYASSRFLFIHYSFSIPGFLLLFFPISWGCGDALCFFLVDFGFCRFVISCMLVVIGNS